jgi:hypothetical protein
MGIAPLGTFITGYFQEASHGKTFEYSDNPEMILSPLAHGGKNVQFPHIVWVGPLSERRFAYVKGSVAHVITDEYERDGQSYWVVEKWDIKKHRKLTA